MTHENSEEQPHTHGHGVTQAPLPGSNALETIEGAWLRIESRPEKVYAAHYDALPFPHAVSHQELGFDLGLTAMAGDLKLSGLVLRLYASHQLLLEQRWNADVLRKQTGEDDLTIAAGTGLRVGPVVLMLHGHAAATLVDVVAVARRTNGETVEARLQMPVFYPQSKTQLDFPLRGAWWCIQAADWSDMHKRELYSQPYALDFVRLNAANGFFSGDGQTLESHASWGQPVLAAAGGKVAYAQHDMPDMPPGQQPDPRIYRDDPRRLLGNAVAISHANGEFAYYAHLQQASLAVREGELVRRGQLIGRVGNSGQSPGPHLHFHLMEGPHLMIDQGLPVRMRNFAAGGQWFAEPVFIPTRMIVFGAESAPESSR